MRVITLAILSVSLALCAQSWDDLRGLQPGDRVRVTDTAGREYKGVFRSVSADTIALQADQTEVALERPRVRQVKVRSNSRRLRNALIGAGAGLAIGMIVDQTLGVRLRNEGNESGRALTYIAPIALFGGIPAALPAYRTVYRLR